MPFTVVNNLRRNFVENHLILGLERISDKVASLKTVLHDLDFATERAGNVESQHSQPQPEQRSLEESFAEDLRPFSTTPPKIGSLETLKKELPDLSCLVNKILQKNPLDGNWIEPHNITSAQSVLDALRSAWMSKWPDSGATETLEIIRKSAGICLILRAIDRVDTIDDFAKAKFHDMSPPISRGDLNRILGNSDADKFDIALYLVKPRQWEDAHIEISSNEPLPLQTIPWDSPPDSPGGFGRVDKVLDVVDGQVYVRKRPNDENAEIAKIAERQLRNEQERLKELGGRSHIVQYVKSYRRGYEYGVLMKPVADGDLSGLLLKAKKPSDYQVDYDFLLKAFGCLSKALAYIHKEKVRHKDIKPANVLYMYERNSSPKNHKFLWADFGNAYGFKNKSTSKTSAGKILSARYAAPEVSHVSWVHDYKSDVFSLGCVFIEILCVFVGGALADLVAENDRKDIPYSKSLRRIRKSIDGHINDSDLDKQLLPLLNLSRDMIKWLRWRRPQIEEVVSRLSAASRAYFCDDCFGVC